MWEAIEQNKRRSWVLIGAMGLILLVLGFLIGAALFADFDSDRPSLARPHDMRQLPGEESRYFTWLDEPASLLNGGGLIGMGIALCVFLISVSVAFLTGAKLLLHIAGARETEKLDAPRLWNVVEEMTIASGLPARPRVFIVDDSAPNAFAVGMKPDVAAVAVTRGLLAKLNRDELQGVIAHEIAHINNYDVRFMTLASVLLGSIVMISEGFLRALWYGAGSRSSSRSDSKGKGFLMLIAVIFAIIAPLMARVLFFACSRRREYLADACAAQYTRYPPGLASALRKIGRAASDKSDVNKSLAPMYIVNPLQARALTTVFATHPPLEKRIAVLSAMSGAGLPDYESAYKSVMGEQDQCLGAKTLKDQTRIKMRPPTPDIEPKSGAVERAREALDLFNRAAHYLILPCACGLRIKVPPRLERNAVRCPRCGKQCEVPRADAPKTPPAEGEPAQPVYRRRDKGWDSFKCACNHTIQLSPAFVADRVSCKNCGRHIRVER